MSALKDKFWSEVEKSERSMKQEVSGRGQIVTIWDNGESRSLAKEAEWRKREKQRKKARDAFAKASATLCQFYDGSTGPILRPTRKRPWKHLYLAALETCRSTAWSQFSFPSLATSGLKYHTEQVIQTPRPANSSVASTATDKEWQLRNETILEHSSVLSIDEADNTIILVARISGLTNPTCPIIVLSGDGDFLVREAASTYRWTISYRFGVKQRWTLTDRNAIVRLDPDVFGDIKVLRIAGCIAGQDYTGVGLKSISWKSIAKDPDTVQVICYAVRSHVYSS